MAAVRLENESRDCSCVRSRRTCAREVRISIDVRRRVTTEEGGVRIVGCGDLRLQAHFRRGQAITALIEVNRRRSGRGVVLRNLARTERAERGRGDATFRQAM